MSIKELSEYIHKEKIKEYSNIPKYAVPRTLYKDTTANGLAKCIKDFCEVNGIMCQRSSNEGRYRPGAVVVDVIGRGRQMKGTWLPGLNNGQGDLHIVLKGMSHWLEIKIGKDRQSDKQKDFEAMVKRSGGTYDIIHDWPEFYNTYSKWKK